MSPIQYTFKRHVDFSALTNYILICCFLSIGFTTKAHSQSIDNANDGIKDSIGLKDLTMI